VRRSFTT